LYCHTPISMWTVQYFTVSVAWHMLDADGTNARTSSNLCTPGTSVFMEKDGELFTSHCTNSTSKTYHGDQWVTAEFLVLADSVVHHIIEGDTVLTYYKPQIGGGSVTNYDPAVKQDGKALKSGYIS